MTKENLKDLIKSYEATDILCPETNLPIFANDEAYMLDTEWYHNDVYINDVIFEKTGGIYRTLEDLYEDSSDYFYWSTYHDENEIFESIINQGYFYDKNGNKIFLSHT